MVESMARIVAAISGGVDSAVATARLVDAGHEVTAVHLLLAPEADERCAAALSAREVAAALDRPFEVWDMRDAFAARVLDDFAGQYAAGLTPNPCLMCNRTIKFGALLPRALEAGFEGVATGHYARVERHASGHVELLRAVDSAKDQSYVLSMLDQATRRRLWLPLGGSTKDEVRAEASRRGLPVAGRAESMDLCFIPDGDTRAWLTARLGPQPGEIVDEAGAVLGRHDGTYRYTVGQRKGLDLRVPAADGEPRFVVGIDAAARRVVVGPREHLAVAALRCEHAVWSSGGAPDGPVQLRVQVRAHGDEHDAVVTAPDDGVIEVALPSPIIGVAPGQTAAFYDGDRVVGSGTITATGAGAKPGVV